MKPRKTDPAPALIKLFAFDGNNHFKRIMSVKAFQYMSYDGRPTGGIAGTVQHVLNQIDKYRPDEVAVTFDGAGARAAKQQHYAGFKAGRSAMDPVEYHQMQITADVLRALGICVLHKGGIDADDTLGALTRVPGRQVLVDSNDKDILQTLTERVRQIRRHESQETLWTPDRVIGHYGVRPSQIPDWLALVGDSVDGIPGLRNCGPQNATKLLNRYGTLPAILEAVVRTPHEFRDKERAAIRAQADQLRIFLRLTTINPGVISSRALEHVIPRLRPKNYSSDLPALLDAHGLKRIKSWTKLHPKNVLSKPAGLWS